MKKLIHKYFVEPLGDYIAFKVMVKWKTDAMQEMAWEVFSVLGLDELDKILTKHKKKNKSGHSDYETLASIYRERLRKLGLDRVKKLEEILKKI